MKMAYHTNGYTYKVPSTGLAVSSPRTSVSHGEDGLRVPRTLVAAIRKSLRSLYPELGDKPFSGTRMCW